MNPRSNAIDTVDTTYDPGAQVNDPGLICLHRNENLFAAELWNADRLAAAVEDVRPSSYPDPSYAELRSGLAEFYGVGQENVFVGNGSDEVISDLLALLRRSYFSIHVLDTCFRVYHMLASRLGYDLQILPGNTFETGHVLSKGTAALAVVDSPNAITGAAVADEEMFALAEPEGSFLIWDNAYGEYAGDAVPTSRPANVVVVRSFSKFWALAGVRVGYCIADEDIVSRLMDQKDVFNVNVFAQRLALAALARYEEFASVLRETVNCRNVLVSALRDRDFTVHDTSSNFVLASHEEHSAQSLQRALAAQGIIVRHFGGPITENHIRITVPPRPTLDVLVERLSRGLEKL